MGLEIPGELADLLNELGYIWPESDETRLLEVGQLWMQLGQDMAPLHEELMQCIETTFASNHGPALEKLLANLQNPRSAPEVLGLVVPGTAVVGATVMICAAVVLALKINVIIQLTVLLLEIIEAVATTEVTFGASLLEIPVFKKLTDLLINLLVNEALEAILG
jgi:hypothetical protein